MVSQYVCHYLVRAHGHAPFHSRFIFHAGRVLARFPKMASTVSHHTQACSPYGSWTSPITADAISVAEKRLGGIAVGDRGRLFILESRPYESGRSVLVGDSEKPGDEWTDVIPEEFSVRTRAQEYGGGAFTIFENALVFSNYKDQRLYKQSIPTSPARGHSYPIPITPDYGGPTVCYADGVLDSRFSRYITIREDQRESSLNPTTTIVGVDLIHNTVEEPKVLVGGNDFYAFPRLDHNGERLAWIEWSHPYMPWDKSELWVGYISNNGHIYKRICVAGGDPSRVEAPTEPKWSSQGELFFITDSKNGFWNIHKWIESKNEMVPLYEIDAEFTRPLWVFGLNSYEFIQRSEERDFIVCSYRQTGRSYIGILNESQNIFAPIDIPFTDISNIALGNGCIYVEGGSAVCPQSVARVIINEFESKVIDFQIIWSSLPIISDFSLYFSVPEFIEFPTKVPGQSAYAYFYPPSNPVCKGNSGEKPPLLLKTHGGPTSEARGILNLGVQYWTSRGWAFVDVNYGGSTGYGRDYRERLLQKWGIVDVNDCCSCAMFLAENGKVDSNRICITGGSAGGYTTLAALAFKDIFKAGASLYGVSDLASLKAESHKFESHYIDNLVGSEINFFERSPINFVDSISSPVIFFQGLEDKVVPPEQSRKIYNALKEKGIPTALVEYEGEGHGFRKAENIKQALEQQLVFFTRLVGKFKIADEIVPLHIDNFDP